MDQQPNNTLQLFNEGIAALRKSGRQVLHLLSLDDSLTLKGLETENFEKYQLLTRAAKTHVKNIAKVATSDHNGITSGHLVAFRNEDNASYAVVVIDLPIEKEELYELKLRMSLVPLSHTGKNGTKVGQSVRAPIAERVGEEELVEVE